MTLEHLPPRPRPSTSCPIHPDQPVTGFCASCLRDRLTQLAPPPPDRKSTSALKSIFSRPRNKPTTTTTSPLLRRSKSFSGVKNSDAISVAFEPQRRSCDVRAQSTLATLFHHDHDGGRLVNSRFEQGEEEEAEGGGGEGGEEEEEEEEEGDSGASEIRAEETVEFRDQGAAAAMKDQIDFDGHTKNTMPDKAPSAIGGGFRHAAAALGKKLQKWRGKKKGGAHGSERSEAATAARDEKPQRARDTQSEVADYGFGRRSCDMGPRFSLDAGRVSLEDPRCSFDGPRASWDGYLMGRVGLPRMTPAMGSVVEDGPVMIGRSDDKILAEMNSIDEDPYVPGGTVQTREYYANSPSWQRRRRSFERSGSLRKPGSVASRTDETRSVSSVKLSPPRMDYFHRNKIADSKDLNLHSGSLRDDCSEIFESASRDAAAVDAGGKGTKKSRRWSKGWNIWGLIKPRGSNAGKDEDVDYDDGRSQCRGNVVERSRSESWRRDVNAEQRMGLDRKVFRSNSSVSWRSSSKVGFENSSSRKVSEGKKRRDEPTLERNRSARYSPSKFDNGLLRFYLAPLSSSRRSGGSEKSGSKNSNLFARSVLRMY